MVRLETTIALAILALTVCGSAHGLERWQTYPTPPPMPVPTRSGYASVNGIQMFYDVYGKGDPILLIHIGMGHADQWAGEIPTLSQRHTVIVADSRGHGRSTRTSVPLTYDLLASDYLALLDYLKIPKVALVGVSDGAIIGLDIAINHPERLRKLFSQGANATTDGARDDALDATASDIATKANEADYRRLSKTPEQLPEFHKALKTMWDNEPQFTTAQLASIKVPTAIVIADHDEWIKEDHARYIARTIPGAKIITLRNVSHYAAQQDPVGYAQAVLQFVDGS
jgi:pimeloyl-ACP methyl ester carboxylesterase